MLLKPWLVKTDVDAEGFKSELKPFDITQKGRISH